MKLIQVGTLAALITLVDGFSFPDLTTGITSVEQNAVYEEMDRDMSTNTFVASLFENGTDNYPFCDGTLITSEFILTTGHCLDSTPMSDVYASIGSKNRMGGGSPASEMIRVVQAFRHPLYNLSSDLMTGTPDVALLKLEKPSKLKPAVLGAADGSNNPPESEGYTLGWGMDNYDSVSDILQIASVKLITNAKCAKLFADANDLQTSLDESVICTVPGKGRDLCLANKGGPLLVNDVIVGMRSSLDDCSILPRTYARISYAVDFIDSVLEGKSVGNITDLLTAGTSAVLDAILLGLAEAEKTPLFKKIEAMNELMDSQIEQQSGASDLENISFVEQHPST
ncbi:hypothetical protein PHMEG_00014895 [Phytophthora megakarya]|uniref:Peptidase S1 domain-containing protein n=1 Tax=Phytophthora megakarya TaxID=4795 RepID=A0A225W477_9STRA|nr:hypothetical protein PHMEG_00014895 [Phytophthora megakarya]